MHHHVKNRISFYPYQATRLAERVKQKDSKAEAGQIES